MFSGWFQQQQNSQQADEKPSGQILAHFMTSTSPKNGSGIPGTHLISNIISMISPAAAVATTSASPVPSTPPTGTSVELNMKSSGLENFGNTCYCNSLIQALFSCRPFRDRVFTSNLLQLPVDAAKEKSVSLLNPLKQLFMAILSAQKSPKANAYQLKDAMKQFIEELRRRNEMFREPVHHDAHELFNYLINEIITEVKEDHTSFVVSRDEEIRNVKGTRRKYFRTGHDLSTVEIDDRDDAESSATAENDLNRHKRKDTWVHELFEGVLSNEIRCVQCETVSSRLEPFLDLSVDIPPTQQNCSILSCLKEFSKIEIMGGRDKFFCSSCNSLQVAQKRMKIYALPRILALHLKRFKYVERLGRHVKLCQRVSFPLTLMLSSSLGNVLYRLFAVVVHVGVNPSHGHYISLIRSNNNSQKWWVYDDTFVEEVDDEYLAKVFGWNPVVNSTTNDDHYPDTPSSSRQNSVRNGTATPGQEELRDVNESISSKGYGSMFGNIVKDKDQNNKENHSDDDTQRKWFFPSISLHSNTSSSSNARNNSSTTHSSTSGTTPTKQEQSGYGKSLLSHGSGYLLFYEVLYS